MTKPSDILRKLQSEIKNLDKELEMAKRIEQLMEVAKSYEGEDKLVAFSEIAEEIKKGREELKIYTGWLELDRIIGGFRPKQLVVVSAVTKHGKTSFLMDLTTRVAAFNPLWLPFEESAEELIRKYLERGQTPPHGFAPSVMKGGEMDWIEAKIIEGVAKYGSQVIFIDQLDFIVPLGGDNHALRVGQAMRDLKGLAKKWNVCIFIICHVVKTDMEKSPTLQDLKGSSSIGQEADTVVLLWRESKKEKGQMIITNNTIVSVQANRRHGTTGYVPMVYEQGRYLEQEWREGEVAETKFSNF